MAPIKKQLQMKLQAREAQIQESNRELFNTIPNVVEAIETMLQLPPEDIRWVEIELADDVLLLGIAISYPATDIPTFVQIFAPSSVDHLDDDIEVISQLVRVGIPIELADQPVQEIVQFFHELASSIQQSDEDDDDETDGDVITPNKQFTFDSSDLTVEQTQKLLLFQHHLSTSKH